MRVRLFVEVEVSDANLLQQLGESLPMVLATGQIELGVARAMEGFLKQVKNIAASKVAVIPQML